MRGNIFRKNLYYGNQAEKPFKLDGVPITLEEWRAVNNKDADSISADPLFVNPEVHDFRLKPGSPAEKIGFDSKAMRLDWSGYVSKK